MDMARRSSLAPHSARLAPLAVQGAGFLVVSLGDITFIPGLPIKPAYYKIDVEFPDGEAPRVVGLS